MSFVLPSTQAFGPSGPFKVGGWGWDWDWDWDSMALKSIGAQVSRRLDFEDWKPTFENT